jgi:3-hydroxyisobutyrate dehydrogenase
MAMTIGFVGLGRMGLPMATNLMRAGHAVTGFDLSPEARAAFEAEGGTCGDSAGAVAGSADLLITMLPNGAIVRAALLDDPGFAGAMRAGSIVMDMSSSSPTDTLALCEALAGKSLTLLDAPVSGGVAKAKDASLAIMVGGPKEAIERVRPALDAMGTSIIETGAIGSAHCMKALNNFVSSAGLVAVSEALHVGKRFGLAPETIVAALNASTGRNNTSERKALPYMVPESYTSGFALDLMAKDIGIAADLARTLDMDATVLSLMETMWREASGELGPTADHTEMHRFVGAMTDKAR